LKVISWNLLRLTGAGVEDVAALIEQHRPDLLLLQEATCAVTMLERRSMGASATRSSTRTGVTSCSNQCSHGRQFAKVLALFIAEMKLTSRWNLPHFCRAPGGGFQSRWRSSVFPHDPANDLRRIDIDRKALHCQLPSKIAGPALPIRRTGVSSRGVRTGRLRVPPPCVIGRLVHRLSRSTPVDVSLPYCLASARRCLHLAMRSGSVP
jgi:hypothetical protein